MAKAPIANFSRLELQERYLKLKRILARRSNRISDLEDRVAELEEDARENLSVISTQTNSIERLEEKYRRSQESRKYIEQKLIAARSASAPQLTQDDELSEQIKRLKATLSIERKRSAELATRVSQLQSGRPTLVKRGATGSDSDELDNGARHTTSVRR